jgi:hypothetical protein
MEDSDSEYSNSSAEGEAFRDRLEGKDWNWIRRKHQKKYFETRSCHFILRLLKLDAPIDLIRQVRDERGRGNHASWLFAGDVTIDEVSFEPFSLSPLTVASIFSSEESFQLVFEEIKKEVESYERLNPCNVERYGPTEVFSDIGLIPLDRLRQICASFPSRCRNRKLPNRNPSYFVKEEQDSLADYLQCRKNETDRGADAVQKYLFALRFRLDQETFDERIFHNQTQFLAPHALFHLYLSQPFDGDDSRKDKRKKKFIEGSLPVFEYLRINAPPENSSALLNNRGESLMHIFLRNVSYRRADRGRRLVLNFTFSLPEESSLRGFCRAIVSAHPGAASVADLEASLPIHIAAEEGIPVLDILVEAYPEGLRQKGGKSHLYPFQLASLSLENSMHQRVNEHLLLQDSDDGIERWREARAVEHTFILLRVDPNVLSFH